MRMFFIKNRALNAFPFFLPLFHIHFILWVSFTSPYIYYGYFFREISSDL